MSSARIKLFIVRVIEWVSHVYSSAGLEIEDLEKALISGYLVRSMFTLCAQFTLAADY